MLCALGYNPRRDRGGPFGGIVISDIETGSAGGSRALGERAIVRPYALADRPAVREICRSTAYRGRGSAAVFEDGELFADYWSSYYTDHEPESCLVLELDGAVIGYL